METGKGKMKKRLVSIASMAITIVVFALLSGMIAPVQAISVPFTIYGQVFDTDGTTPVDGVNVTVTNLETGSSAEPTVTASGGRYADNLGNLRPNSTHSEGDRIQIFADNGVGKTNTTVVSRAVTSPQQVDLILQTPTPSPTPTPTPTPSYVRGGGGGRRVTPTPSPTPTPVVSPTPTPTATPTVTPATPTPRPTPTPTPKPGIPGFKAMFAIAGLLAVAYLVLRRRR